MRTSCYGMSCVSWGRLCKWGVNVPVNYIGSLTVSRPGFLVFSETFDPGWELSLARDGKQADDPEKVLVNIFANGWFIEEPGTYDFILKYAPQDKLILGGLSSLFFLAGVLCYNLKTKNKSL